MGHIPEKMIGAFLSDIGWTCDHCDHHNDDIYNDVCGNCGEDRSEGEE